MKYLAAIAIAKSLQTGYLENNKGEGVPFLQILHKGKLVSIQELNTAFGISNILHFENTSAGLVRAQITTPAAKATVYLHGAHITHWQPTAQQPVLFTSAKSTFAPAEPIRGGIPVLFPWFGPYTGPVREGQTYATHGFARLQSWTVVSAAMAGEDLHLVLSLAPNEQSRALGFDHFRLEYSLRIGRTLEAALTVHNDAAEPLQFEEALHTYFEIADIHKTSVAGLAGTTYLDKIDSLKHKVQGEAPLSFGQKTDSVYLDTAATCVIHDAGNNRGISVAKSGSKTTVVWNPGVESASIPDLLPDDWHNFLCVETVNANSNRLTLAPGKSHRMAASITVQSE